MDEEERERKMEELLRRANEKLDKVSKSSFEEALKLFEESYADIMEVGSLFMESFRDLSEKSRKTDDLKVKR
jgi:hypothetical protein